MHFYSNSYNNRLGLAGLLLVLQFPEIKSRQTVQIYIQRSCDILATQRARHCTVEDWDCVLRNSWSNGIALTRNHALRTDADLQLTYTGGSKYFFANFLLVAMCTLVPAPLVYGIACKLLRLQVPTRSNQPSVNSMASDKDPAYCLLHGELKTMVTRHNVLYLKLRHMCF